MSEQQLALTAVELEIPTICLGTPDEDGRWMGARGAALLAAERYAYPRVHARQTDDRPADLEVLAPSASGPVAA